MPRFSAGNADAFTHHGGDFDVVISCDNCVPHLLNVRQGRAYEGLTCNALEWIVSFGDGSAVPRVLSAEK